MGMSIKRSAPTMDQLAAQHPSAKRFKDVAMYRSGMFGCNRTDCKDVLVIEHVQYAQYENAIKVIYLEAGKRTLKAFILDYKPFLVLVDKKNAIDPPDVFQEENGARVAVSYDPAHIPAFLKALGQTPVLFKIEETYRTASKFNSGEVTQC